MEFRNPAYNAYGTIDCEINHPQYGWIPFTADPNDTGAAFDVAEVFAELGATAAAYVPPTAEELAALEAERQAAITAAIKSRFDDLSGIDRVLLKIAFLQENRIRLLEGKAEITKEQFRTWVDAQI